MEMALWEQLLLGAGALLLVFLFRPGIKAALEKSRTAEHKDWRGALLPIGAVVLFVIVLILLARG
jgi:threonine/homoserine/homoserine lactone efflux protein